MKRELKEGDWVAYNWLDDEGNDNWKIGRIVKTETNGLMYFNYDGTERSGYIPITDGVKLVTNDKIRYLFIHLKVQDGEREHDHRVLHTTTAKNLDFVAERYVASYWGYSELERSTGSWYAHGGEIAMRLETYRELTEEEYNFLNELF